MKFPLTHYEWMLRDHITLVTDQIVQKFGKDYNLSFEEFANFFTEFPGVMEHRIEQGLNNVNLLARQVYHCYKMKCNGEKIYYMSRKVCDLLKDTRLTIDAEFIESPFEQIYIYTDQEDIVLTDYSGTRPMKGIYIQLTTECFKKKLRFIVTSGIDGIGENRDINYFATFNIPEHGDLETIANKDINKFIEDKKILNNDVNMNIMKEVFIFCVNALLYIGCKNVDFINFTPENLTEALARKKSNSKKSKIERVIKKTSQLPFIIISPKKGENEKEGISEIGKKLDHQVLVSGHWRGQWSGPVEDKKREIIRIKSYLKGIGLKEGESKPYLVK